MVINLLISFVNCVLSFVLFVLFLKNNDNNKYVFILSVLNIIQMAYYILTLNYNVSFAIIFYEPILFVSFMTNIVTIVICFVDIVFNLIKKKKRDSKKTTCKKTFIKILILYLSLFVIFVIDYVINSNSVKNVDIVFSYVYHGSYTIGSGGTIICTVEDNEIKETEYLKIDNIFPKTLKEVDEDTLKELGYDIVVEDFDIYVYKDGKVIASETVNEPNVTIHDIYYNYK